MTPETATLLTLLARAETFPDVRIGVLDRGEREQHLTWGEIGARARTVAGGLQAAGVEPGHTVALVFPTGFEFLAAFFGALLAGAVPVPLYPPARLGRLDEYHQRTAAMLRAARACIVLVDGRRSAAGRSTTSPPVRPRRSRCRRRTSAWCSFPRARPWTPNR